MCIRDSKEHDWDTTLLATDISAAALAAARRGIYESRTVAQLPERWRKLYFQRLDSAHVQVAAKLRQEIVFRQFNLITPHFPFRRKFHVIFCRNVMIYFDKPTPVSYTHLDVYKRQAVYGRAGLEADGLSDLPHGRRIASFEERFFDAFEN